MSICKTCAAGADLIASVANKGSVDTDSIALAEELHAACGDKCDCQHAVGAQLAGKALR